MRRRTFPQITKDDCTNSGPLVCSRMKQSIRTFHASKRSNRNAANL
jgi:hypothetical protein